MKVIYTIIRDGSSVFVSTVIFLCCGLESMNNGFLVNLLGCNLLSSSYSPDGRTAHRNATRV